jgi:ADP-ribosylglycohydrolase
MPDPLPHARPTMLSRFTGCLLGGAVGDALGAPVEFWSRAEIEARCGPNGVREYLPAYGRTGAITDDTQMTLFTAEGLLLAAPSATEADPPLGRYVRATHRAYLRWLRTQDGARVAAPDDGFLLSLPALHSRRAPGNTCLSALRSAAMGAVQRPLNDSKGCGGVMRVAPAGLARIRPVFRLGCEVAAITHGHPSGYLSAGFLAALIAAVLDGASLPAAIQTARAELRAWPHHDECLAAVDHALTLAAGGPRTAAMLEQLGGGWTGEEALAIALFCALTAPDFEDAVALAVAHAGDSDSTGAITGNILGALWGTDAIPPPGSPGWSCATRSRRSPSSSTNASAGWPAPRSRSPLLPEGGLGQRAGARMLDRENPFVICFAKSVTTPTRIRSRRVGAGLYHPHGFSASDGISLSASSAACGWGGGWTGGSTPARPWR